MSRNLLMLTFLKVEFQIAKVMRSFLLFSTFFDKNIDVASKTRIIRTIFQLQIKISKLFLII